MSTISRLLGEVGYNIGLYPRTYLGVSLFICFLSAFGLVFRLDIQVNVNSGFTRRDAPSNNELQAYLDFFDNRGDPWYMALFAVSRNASMLAEREVNELTTFHEYLTKKMSIELNGKNMTFEDDLCQPFCSFNSQLWQLLRYQSVISLKYPLTTIGPYQANIGKYFFERTVDKTGFMKAAKTIALYFAAFVDSDEKKAQLQIFEENSLRAALANNADLSKHVYYVVHGVHVVSKEIERGILLAMPYYLAGCVLLVLFVLLCIITSSIYFSQFNFGKVSIAFVAILSPLLAALSAIGSMLLVGLHINMLTLISPFLTLAIGIGVDGAFLITNTWLMHSETIISSGSYARAKRLQKVFESEGPDITISSLTNVLAFSFGCLAPAYELQLFSASVALSMLFDYVFQMTIFSPCLVLLSKYDEVPEGYIPANSTKSISTESSLRKRIRFFVKSYSSFVTSFGAEIITVAIMIPYLYLNISSISKMQVNMDGKLLLPPDSPSNEGVRILSNVVWSDYLNINYIVKKPPNFTDPDQFKRFKQFVQDIESLDNSIGPDSTMMWVSDYQRYLADPNASMLDLLFEIFDSSNPRLELNSADQLDMSHFQSFIETSPYDAWRDGVHFTLDMDNRTIITSMIVISGYKRMSSLADKARLMPYCREVANRYPEFEILPFDTDSRLVDVIIAVPSATKHTVLYTICACAIVFLLFSCNIVAAMLSALSVASISTGVLGMMSYWECNLDPLTMVSVILSTGLAVDYTVHVIFHYLEDEEKFTNKSARIRNVLNKCGLSIFQAGISTLSILMPVLFAPVGAYVVIAKAVILVVVLGLFHGLFVLPVLLTALPSSISKNVACFFNDRNPIMMR